MARGCVLGICTVAPPGGASGAERSEAALGATKEVLGFIIDLDFNWDFLGFPIRLLGFPGIFLGFPLGFYQDFDLILILI